MRDERPEIGISAITTYVPPWLLGNKWFAGLMPRKFEQHTGIRCRRISSEDEVTMAVRATEKLRRDVGFDLRDCAMAVFVSPSFVPIQAARKWLTDARLVRRESLRRAARRFGRRLGLPEGRAIGINWFCSGYAKAMSIIRRRIIEKTLNLAADQFVLIATASRISRITDYGCPQTGPLFGDLATATLVARSDSRRYPARFWLLHADAERQATNGAFFDFHLRHNVLVPTPCGERAYDSRRLVFSLDGMSVADAAPRAMSNALSKSIAEAGIPAHQLRYVVPHQAGTGIVRLAAMKFEQIDVRADVLGDLTTRVGNVSSCSIPFALHRLWYRLQGDIACPTAAVGLPGIAEISQGCILLRATPFKVRRASAA
jgi:3-oxoacyl-[acyl-carrier-protein] synthase III